MSAELNQSSLPSIRCISLQAPIAKSHQLKESGNTSRPPRTQYHVNGEMQSGGLPVNLGGTAISATQTASIVQMASRYIPPHLRSKQATAPEAEAAGELLLPVIQLVARPGTAFLMISYPSKRFITIFGKTAKLFTVVTISLYIHLPRTRMV